MRKHIFMEQLTLLKTYIWSANAKKLWGVLLLHSSSVCPSFSSPLKFEVAASVAVAQVVLIGENSFSFSGHHIAILWFS